MKRLANRMNPLFMEKTKLVTHYTEQKRFDRQNSTNEQCPFQQIIICKCPDDCGVAACARWTKKLRAGKTRGHPNESTHPTMVASSVEITVQAYKPMQRTSTRILSLPHCIDFEFRVLYFCLHYSFQMLNSRSLLAFGFCVLLVHGQDWGGMGNGGEMGSPDMQGGGYGKF
jgi:hypothetical protein